MPDIIRQPLRMDCMGLDLTHPIDRMPPGGFPYLFNARVLVEGRIEARPGYTQSLSVVDPNSIRRLNDSTGLAPSGYIYVGGGGTKLYAGTEGDYNPIDTGYSGDPLSLIPFQPTNSPQSWMYVWDRLKNSKVRPDGVIQAIGVVPPRRAPVIEYGTPASVSITDGQVATGWTATGISTTVSTADRTNVGGGSQDTIGSIFYDAIGDTGWCHIQPTNSTPSLLQTFWMGDRMKVILNSGGANQETVLVKEVHTNSVAAGTILQSIIYDSGTSGLCSLVLSTSSPGLERNSILEIDTELVRVLQVVQSPDGSTYSVRCSTVNTHAAGATVIGVLTWYVYTTLTHVSTETITSVNLEVDMSASGVGSAQLTANINASVANGRAVDPANDYLHISIFLQNPQNVTNIQLLLALDPTPNFSFTNPGNSYIFTITPSQLSQGGSSGDSWSEVVVPISSAVRSGLDLTRTLANISGIAVQMTATGACAYGFDWWYLFGTYGPTIQPNAPTGYLYASRFRNSGTGAYSVPSPVTRYQLFPLREAVMVTPQASNQIGVDEIDIYRQGGTITSLLYVASEANNFGTPGTYIDTLPDSFVNDLDQPVDLTAIQPWPTLIPPIQGTCNVSGTSVVWVSGDGKFPLQLLNNTAIIINGQTFLTYGQPASQTMLELTQDAGSLTGATFQIESPTIAGQPLPYVFGPLEGPFAPVLFALGDINNPDNLYFSNFSNADAASDANFISISTPSAGLVSGAVWNGLCFAGSRDLVYCIRYSYLTEIGASNSTTYQWQKVNTPSGMWSRWSCCFTPIGVAYLGRDGIYICTDTQGVNITDEKLYPLFPHDGQPASAVNSGSNIILPVDMTQANYLRLSYCDETLRFSYIDTGGNFQTLLYEIYKKRWFLNNYANHISYHYLVEQPMIGGLNDEEILMLSLDTNSIVRSGGNDDSGVAINTVVLTPSFDGGDERSQKLYVDTMTQADGVGSLIIAATYNNAQTFSPVVTITPSGGIQQYLQNISSLSNLALYRNVGCKFAWTGGPAGPRIYAWEMSGFLQPYLSTFFVTQYFPFSFPGWKHMRRMFPALISNAPVLFTVRTQDGRTYGPYTITSTGGQYRILPQMLNHGIKDLAFALQLDGQGQPFAFFPQDFVVEMKQWVEESYIDLAVFRA